MSRQRIVPLLKAHRYILRELVPPFIGGTLLFVAVILANTIIGQSEDIFHLRASPRAIFTWLFYRLPFICTVAFPVGAMLGTSLTVIRMGREIGRASCREIG